MKTNKSPISFDYNLEALNLVDSISKAKRLYQQLIIVAHPDKNPNNIDAATKLTNELNESRFNYNELLKLEDKIMKELTRT